MVDFNNNHTAINTEKTVLDLFAECVANNSTGTAIVDGENIITYSELEKRSNAVAYFLLKRKLNKGGFVPICTEKSIDAIVGLLGVLKAGGCFVPLNSYLPTERLSQVLAEIDSDFILCSQEVFDDLKDQVEQECILLDNITFKESETKEFPKITNANQNAYMIYTSGSTGMPKGVMVGHAALYDRTLMWKDLYQLDENTNLLQMANFSFDVFIGDVCRSLFIGGKLVLAHAQNFEPYTLYAAIEKHQIHTLEFTPSIVIPLMKYIDENDLSIRNLKTVIIGSDVCGVKEFETLTKRFGNSLRIVNSYGSTETTIDASCFETTADFNFNQYHSLPIGKPLRNTSFYILDKSLNPLPMGVIGEMYIGGVGVANGYFNRPELTAEKFIDNPFKEGEKMYRTGDLGRWLPSGDIEYIGRQDDQVKLRGYRIELGEIEKNLERLEGITKSLVTVQGEGSDAYLVGYYTSQEAITRQEIEGHLQAFLPEYMIPSVYVHLEYFPLTSNGKIDRKSLPKAQAGAHQEYQAPRSVLEEQMTLLWSDILKMDAETIGVTSSFFELGGHSLSAISLKYQVLKSIGFDLSIRDIFMNPTIQTLAEFIDNSTWLSDENFNQNEEDGDEDDYMEITI